MGRREISLSASRSVSRVPVRRNGWTVGWSVWLVIQWLDEIFHPTTAFRVMGMFAMPGETVWVAKNVRRREEQSGR